MCMESAWSRADVDGAKKIGLDLICVGGGLLIRLFRWSGMSGSETSMSGWQPAQRNDGRTKMWAFEGLTINAATDSWTVDFMTRPGESREAIHKWLKCKSVPSRRQQRLLQALWQLPVWTVAQQDWKGNGFNGKGL